MTTITVDFSTPTYPKNQSGFLLGNLTANFPADALLTPLKPAYWRLAPESSPFAAATRAIALGAKPIICLSDGYGYPATYNGNPAPYSDNYATWTTYATTTATAYKNAGLSVYWDCWNEPDIWGSPNTNPFWDGNQAQAFAAYKAAYNAIKAVDANAVIGGPSFGNYDQADTTLWLNYCWQNGLKPGWVGWHELVNADSNIPAIATDLTYFRSLFHGYPGFTACKFLVPESVGPSSHLAPGDILEYLYYLEQGGSDGACKSCWTAADSSNFCFNGRLDGLLASDGTAAASWWAYKTYADGINSRVTATTDNANCIAMASTSPNQVLIGYGGTGFTTPITVTVNLNHLDSAGFNGSSVTATVKKIPNSGETAVSALTSVSSSSLTITSHSASLSISIALHEQFVITLS